VRKEQADKKRKLLWGDKKKAGEAQPTWSAAAFEDPSRKSKFLCLIGAKKKEVYDPLAPTGDSPEREEIPQPETKIQDAVDDFYAKSNVSTQEKQFADLEKQYEVAMDRKEKQSTFGGRLGLGAEFS